MSKVLKKVQHTPEILSLTHKKARRPTRFSHYSAVIF